MRLLVALALGCTGEHPIDDGLPTGVGAGPSGSFTDRIVAASGPWVDVLFVVDNSSSMWDEQALLAERGRPLAEAILDLGRDVHIGVTASGVVPTETGWAGGGRLAERAGARWIASGDPSPGAAFAQLIVQGTDGSGGEAALEAVRRAHQEHLDDPNAGFFRAGAQHTIVVSDEPDLSYADDAGVSAWVDWYDGLSRSPNQRTFSSIGRRVPRQIAGSHPLADIVAQIGGGLAYLDDADWVRVLYALPLRAVADDGRYFLSRTPVVRSIEVAIEGVAPEPVGLARGRLADDGSFERGDWTYDADLNAVRLAAPPEDPEAIVAITYRIQGGGGGCTTAPAPVLAALAWLAGLVLRRRRATVRSHREHGMLGAQPRHGEAAAAPGARCRP